MFIVWLLGILIGGAILGTLLSKVQTRAVLAGLAVNAGVWISYTAVKILPEMAGFYAKTLLKAFEATEPTMITVVAALMREITGVEISPEEAIRLGRSGSLLEFGKVLARGTGQRIFDAVTPPTALTPAGAKAFIEDLMGISASFAIDDWWDHSILEMVSLGQVQWAADLSNAVAKGFGLETFGRLGQRTLFKGSLGPALEVYLNRTYAPARLSATQAIDAQQQDLLTDQQALEALRDDGYDYATAITLMNLRQQDFSETNVELLWRGGRLSEDQLTRWARRQGYGADRAALAVEALKLRRTFTRLEEVADQARRLYRAGQMSRSTLDEFLRQARFTPAESQLMVLADDLAVREQRQLSKGEILEGYREGGLDAPETRALLRALRYSDQAIDILLAAQRKVLSPAQVIDALTRGILDRGTALARLVAQGYSQEDAQLLVDLRQLRLTSGQVLDAFGRGLLPVDRARAFLIELGFPAEMADLLLAFQARTLSAADVTAALVRGLVTEGAARARLLALGYSEADAALLLALRFQLLSAGQVLDAYEGGLLTRRSVLDRLQALGFTLEDAEIILLRFEGKIDRADRPRPQAG